MLQVASGILRGVPLRSPSGNQTRPSSERLRQGTFNVLRHFRFQDSNIVDGALVVDLFAGTGAWGIEALSNGASEAWFVESHHLALKALQDNLAKTVQCFESQSLEAPKLEVLRRDVAQAYKKLPATRLMFCDPPYELGWFEKVIRLESVENKIEKGGLLLFEADESETVPSNSGSLKLFDTKIYGDSAVHFFVKER